MTEQKCNAFQEDLITAGLSVLDDCTLCKKKGVAVAVGDHKDKTDKSQGAVPAPAPAALLLYCSKCLN